VSQIRRPKGLIYMMGLGSGMRLDGYDRTASR
jgi:hypothetical protein